jgi:hypothetical protein
MSDKRSVSTDALETLGTILEPGSGGRDAIHLAVEPVEAGELLDPGDGIALENGLALGASLENSLGIVDPFLRRSVKKGERFWLVVMPRQITSLRHVWTHPGFPEPSSSSAVAAEAPSKSKEVSEKWLRDYCRKNDCPSYNTILDVVNDKAEEVDGYGGASHIEGEYFFSVGEDAHGSIPSEFWDHVEIVTGKKLTNRPVYFSCSC